ncbi:hypothetical protein BU17DRAFT_92679 [Hysterangium stoloniferum]|nr:hypothetical protein BU17DRAFT_92679 [Hysterangium stoloniferum]
MSPSPSVHPPSPSSSSSSLELLAFSYDQSSPHTEYPNDNEPASAPSTPRRLSRDAPLNTAGSRVKDEESLLGIGRDARRNTDDIDMDPFEKGEWVLISTSSLLVVALIVASILMMLGKGATE